MSTALEIVLLIVIAIVVIISLVYISKASVSIGDVSGYKDDKNLDLAYKYTTWCTATCWILIIFLIVGLIFLVIFGPELIFVWGGVLIGGLVLLMMAFAFAIGVLAAMSAYYINKSKLSADPNAHSAYIDCIISAVVSLGVIGILFLTFIYFFVRKHQHDEKISEAQSNLRRIKTEQYVRKILNESDDNIVVGK